MTQLHAARDIKAVLDAGFLLAAAPVAVEVGAWSPELLRGEPRVTIELGDGTIGEPRGHRAPGTWWKVNQTPATLGAVTATLGPSSTIASALSGVPDASATISILFVDGGTTGASSTIDYQVSVDGGGSYTGGLPLLDATTITVHGVTVDLGAGTVATAGDLLTWTQTRATSDLARPMLDNEQTYTLSIHAPSSGGVADISAESAQDATDQLLRVTMATLRNALAGPFRAPARVTWPKKIPGYPAFVHGSLVVVSLVLASPILDAPAGAGQALELEMDGAVDFGAGPQTVVTALALET